MKVWIVNCFENVNVTDTAHQPNSIICSTEESIAQYGSANLGDYQFVNQVIFYSLSLLYTLFITNI